jgi:hypothetical protein
MDFRQIYGCLWLEVVSHIIYSYDHASLDAKSHTSCDNDLHVDQNANHDNDHNDTA